MRRTELAARPALLVLGAGLGLVLLAFVFDAAPLFVPGIALATIGALTPLWVLASVGGARAGRQLASDRVIEGRPLRTTLELRRAPLGGWGLLSVLDPLSETTLALGGALTRRSRTLRVVLDGAPARRGAHRIPPPSLIASDPLSLARAQRSGGGPAQTMLVLPRIDPVRWLGAGGGLRASGGEGDGRSEALAATDFEGLRPYRPGTPASRIHWPALARGRGLVERRLAADADERPLVVLDARVRGRDPEPLDAAVRAAASLVRELARTGGCGLLLPGETRPTIVDSELAAWPVLHARLAVLGTATDLVTPGVPALTTAAGRSGPLVYVAAVSHARLAVTLAARRAPVVLVVPESELQDGHPRGTGVRVRPVLAVGGCRGFTIGARRVPARPGPEPVGSGRAPGSPGRDPGPTGRDPGGSVPPAGPLGRR